MSRPTGETNRRLTDQERRAKAMAERARETRRNAEAEKRARLAHELEQLAKAPLTPGARLTPKERGRIKDRVQGGRKAQSFYPQGGFVRPGDI